jgi:hypothetical protein
MKNIQLTHEGLVFSKLDGDEKKAIYYNEELNNLIIVATDAMEEEAQALAAQIAEAYEAGEIDEYPYNAQGVIEVDLDAEEFNDTIEDALGFLTEKRLSALLESVECSPDSTVLIHKPYHTTTDYIINLDLNPKILKQLSTAEVINVFKHSLPKELPAYKTIMIINGKAYRYN